jgi:hypothetical protein
MANTGKVTTNAEVQTEGGMKTTVIGKTKVHWDDSKMRSSYANVANVATTREELMLLFGTNRAWSQVTEEVTVELSERIILNPHAAKRLLTMLAKTLEDYERNYGSLG